MPKHDVPDRNM